MPATKKKSITKSKVPTKSNNKRKNNTRATKKKNKNRRRSSKQKKKSSSMKGGNPEEMPIPNILNGSINEDNLFTLIDGKKICALKGYGQDIKGADGDNFDKALNDFIEKTNKNQKNQTVLTFDGDDLTDKDFTVAIPRFLEKSTDNIVIAFKINDTLSYTKEEKEMFTKFKELNEVVKNASQKLNEVAENPNPENVDTVKMQRMQYIEFLCQKYKKEGLDKGLDYCKRFYIFSINPNLNRINELAPILFPNKFTEKDTLFNKKFEYLDKLSYDEGSLDESGLKSIFNHNNFKPKVGFSPDESWDKCAFGGFLHICNALNVKEFDLFSRNNVGKYNIYFFNGGITPVTELIAIMDCLGLNKESIVDDDKKKIFFVYELKRQKDGQPMKEKDEKKNVADLFNYLLPKESIEKKK